VKYVFITVLISASTSFASQVHEDPTPYEVQCRVSDRQPMASDCKQHILFLTSGKAKFSNGKAKIGIWGPGSPSGELTDYFLLADESTKKMELKIVRRINEKFLTYKTMADYSKIGDLVNLDFEFGDENCVSRKVKFHCSVETAE